MLPEGSIFAEQVWKRFRPDRSATSALRLQAQIIRDRLSSGYSVDWHWALRDVELKAEPGDAVGLIGNNGSGKSTLLKVLSRVMFPHSGRVEVNGRVGALIEVRAGIHPELTGRENVFMYGTLLGLSRADVRARFDSIVEFAEVGHAIDRQVKYYSSGMQMRLGFSVAAFLEPDILLVDEVLAVGDQRFQQQCLDRMRTVLNQGTTLVYVSHDLPTVEAICTSGVWLDRGRVAETGPIAEVMQLYRQSVESAAEHLGKSDEPVRVADVAINRDEPPSPGAPLTIELKLESDEPREGRCFLGVSEGTSHPIFVVATEAHLDAGVTGLTCRIDQLPVPRGRYFVWASYFEPTTRMDLMSWQPISNFDVMGAPATTPPRAVVQPSAVYVKAAWESTAD